MKKSNDIHDTSIPSATLRPEPEPLNSQSDSERRTELARLLPLWPGEIADLSITGRRHIIATIERALRAERRRGKAGHWAYDLARHAALAKTWKCECAALLLIERRQAGNKGSLDIPLPPIRTR